MVNPADAPAPRDDAQAGTLDPMLPEGAHASRIAPGSVLQHYEIIRPLGAGGMGAVYLSRDTRLGRLVAIKLLRDHGAGAERMLMEARATARLSHENIVAIHELGEHHGTPYLVLEYLAGKTLQQLLDERREGLRRAQPKAIDTQMPTLRRRAAPTHAAVAQPMAIDTQMRTVNAAGHRAPLGSDPDPQSSLPPRSFGWSPDALQGLPPERVVALVIPVVRALSCAHEQGMIHRDLKPANIMLTDTGVVKVLDFGIAKVLGSPDEATEGGPVDQALHEDSGLLGSVPYMSPEQWGAGPVDHRTDLWGVGILLAELLLGRHPLEPLGPRTIARVRRLDTPMPSFQERFPELGKLASIIDRCLIKRCEDRMGSARELLAELESLAGAIDAPSGDAAQNPYAGLSPFREDDAPRFFGRTAMVAEVMAQLGERPLLAIVGPSGAGKSSFVRAGVIPALGHTGEAWEAFTLRPGPHPLLALAELLLTSAFQSALRTPDPAQRGAQRAVAPIAEDREALAATLRAEPGLLGSTLRARARRKMKRVLLFVDQFEEIYTLSTEGDRAAFIACLSGAADDAGSPLRVVLTLRSDFLDRLAEARAAGAALRRGILLLPPMDRDGLREALVRPLDAVGHHFDPPELVEEMLDAVEQTSSALPLLSFAAAKLWEQRDPSGRRLTEASYRRIGGIAGTLAGHADELLGAMTPEERRLARAALLRLITPERTRALCSMAELCELAAAPEEMRRVLGRLTDARLLSIEGAGEADAMVEIVHESLIATWPTLAAWVAENQEDAAFLGKLRHAAREWEASGRSEDLLWRGQAALSARHWVERYAGELAPAEQRYVKAVIALSERARRLRFRLIGGAFAALAVIAVVVSTLAWQERRAHRAAAAFASAAEQQAGRAHQEAARAQEEASRARDSVRVAIAREREDDPTTALVLLRELERPEAPRGWTSLAWQTLHTNVFQVGLIHPGSVSSVAWSPDGQRVASACDDTIVRVWHADGSGAPIVLRGHAASVTWVAWSPEGRRIASASTDATVRVWSADGSGAPIVLRGHKDVVNSAAFSPDGQYIVSSSNDGTARIVRADGTGEPLVFRVSERFVSSAAFSPDGGRLVTASYDGTVRVFSVGGAERPLVLRGHDNAVTRVAFSPDGQRIASSSGDATVRVWRADGTGEPLVLRGHDDWALSVAWSPEGERLASAGLDRTVRIWRADGTGEPLVLRGHEAWVESVAFSPDGQRVASASLDAMVRIWSARAMGGQLVLRGHHDQVLSAAWSPDGQRVASASLDRTVRVWRADGTGEPLVFRGHPGPLTSVAWSPEGQRLASGSDDAMVRLWRLDGTGEPLVLHGHRAAVMSVAFSPDGRQVVSASEDAEVRIWRSDSADAPLVLRGHATAVNSAVFSPDGRYVASGSHDKTVRIWRADGTGEPLVLRGHEAPVLSVRFSPDGQRLASSSFDGTARIWRADGTGEPLVLRGHEEGVLSVDFSPEGERIVTASSDGTVRLWDAARGGEPLVVLHHGKGATSAAFSPDGARVVSSSIDGTVRIWDDLRPIALDDERLWSATTYCMSVERRQRLLGVSLEQAQSDEDRCLRGVAHASGERP